MKHCFAQQLKLLKIIILAGILSKLKKQFATFAYTRVLAFIHRQPEYPLLPKISCLTLLGQESYQSVLA